MIGRLEPVAPKVAALLTEAEDDLIAFYALPAEHWPKLRSTNPLERVNREIGRRSDVVGIFPNEEALLRLAASLLIEQNDEWLVGRRYMSEGSMALVLGRSPEPEVTPSDPAAGDRLVSAALAQPVRRARCGALACGSVASGARRGTLERSIPV